MILWHFTRCGKFSEGLMCLSIEWKLYTCRNSNREQLRKIHQLLHMLCLYFRGSFNIVKNAVVICLPTRSQCTSINIR